VIRATLAEIRRTCRCPRRDPAAPCVKRLEICSPAVCRRCWLTASPTFCLRGLPLLPRLIAAAARRAPASESIPRPDRSGLFVDHGMGVVSGDSQLGADVTIYQESRSRTGFATASVIPRSRTTSRRLRAKLLDRSSSATVQRSAPTPSDPRRAAELDGGRNPGHPCASRPRPERSRRDWVTSTGSDRRCDQGSRAQDRPLEQGDAPRSNRHPQVNRRTRGRLAGCTGRSAVTTPAG